MDFSDTILRPALHRIKSTFASTNSSSYDGFISRLLSFTGSFNDRTRLLRGHDAELGGRPAQTEEAAGAAPPPGPPPQAPEAAAPAAAPATATAGHPFDIEAGMTTPLAPASGTGPEAPAEEPATDTEQVDAESRRVGKSVQTVCLFVASASLVLFANLPTNKQQATGPGGAAAPPAAAGQQHPLLYSADLAFISLGFFSSLGLSMFSIVARPGEAAVTTRVQKWGMVVAMASVVVAFSLRMCMTPAA